MIAGNGEVVRCNANRNMTIPKRALVISPSAAAGQWRRHVQHGQSTSSGQLFPVERSLFSFTMHCLHAHEATLTGVIPWKGRGLPYYLGFPEPLTRCSLYLREKTGDRALSERTLKCLSAATEMPPMRAVQHSCCLPRDGDYYIRCYW